MFDYFALGKALLKLYELTQAKNKRDVSNELRRFFNGEKPGDGHSVRLGDGHGDSEKSTGEMASLVGGINALLSTSDGAPSFSLQKIINNEGPPSQKRCSYQGLLQANQLRACCLGFMCRCQQRHG